MNESILKALMKLFAILTDIKEENITGNSRELVTAYLEKHFDQEHVEKYLAIFDQYLNYYHGVEDWQDDRHVKKRTAANSVKVLSICQQINEELEREPKLFVLLELMEFIKRDGGPAINDIEFVDIIASNLNIKPEEYDNLKAFIYGEIENVPDKNLLLLVDGKETYGPEELKHLFHSRFTGHVYFLHIRSTNTFVFFYKGDRNLYLNGHKVQTGKTYIFPQGSIIRTSRITPIYYSIVSSAFIQAESNVRISYKAHDILFTFPYSKDGIHKFNFEAESGQLIGIMGGSGVGKSTLLNVMNGSLKLKSGNITINGWDLHRDRDKLKGAIGFVPQDDLLIDELTVYQNLYYNAKLCFDDYTEERLIKVVDSALQNFDLMEARDLKVGNPLKRILSGGQRKRLNIAIELIREPLVLFVDEPTSGLSSMDSEKVMLLLKKQTFKGKIVVVNIHQPSSDLYKLFDKVLYMDKGGRMVYNGNPTDAITYFQTKANYVNPSDSECLSCGNVKTDRALRILEARMVDPYGRQIRKRKVAAEQWYKMYLTEYEATHPISNDEKTELPPNSFNKPSRFKQFKIFSIRNLLSKLTNSEYIMITLFEMPVLALILGYFTKYLAGTAENPDAYIFAGNKNLVSYLFMSVIVSLFVGLILSAEEIIKDRKLLKREAFLDLSYSSYLHSKILILFAISAVQTLMYVLIGNYILEIQDMTLRYWLLLFTTSCVANMLGLNISSGLDSVISIYILVPFILVPQLLLSGVVVNFNDLHKTIANERNVPFMADIMVSRWSFEALAVTQFKDNAYEKNFFALEFIESQSNYVSNYLVPELETRIHAANMKMIKGNNSEEMAKYLSIARNEIRKLNADKSIKVAPFSRIDSLYPATFSSNSAQMAVQYLDLVGQFFSNKQGLATAALDKKFELLSQKLGKNKVQDLKRHYHNDALSNIVLDKMQSQGIIECDSSLVRRKDPIFFRSESNIGRAHFYAPSKQLGPLKIDTYWFNVLVMWIYSIALYIMLRKQSLRKTLKFIERLRFRNPAKIEYKRQ